MPTRRMMASGSATDVPPNFMTTLTTASPSRVGRVGHGNPPDLLDLPGVPDLAQQPLPMHQLGVQDGCPCGAANGVVPERDELVVEDRAAPEPADGHRHAAVPIRVERRLRTIGFRQVHDWLRRRGW